MLSKQKDKNLVNSITILSVSIGVVIIALTILAMIILLSSNFERLISESEVGNKSYKDIIIAISICASSFAIIFGIVNILISCIFHKYNESKLVAFSLLFFNLICLPIGIGVGAYGSAIILDKYTSKPSLG